MARNKYKPITPQRYPCFVAVPETIPVRFSEEDAEYLTVRPVRRQTFRFAELVDMILSVTGKNSGRIQQILRSGSIVFHFYRYSWAGFEVSTAEVDEALARYPDPDPSREFRADACTEILLESSAASRRLPVEVDRKGASRRRLFRRRSAWQVLLDSARGAAPEYGGYSYSRRADLYSLAPPPARAAEILAQAAAAAPRALRVALGRVKEPARIVFVCPR